jgi:zinc/manganese transport system substrate-binding protein
LFNRESPSIMKRYLFLIAIATGSMFGAKGAPSLRVAATHPLIGDVARQVGGSHVEVIDLLRPGGDLHHFEPSPRDFAALRGARLVLASGKHLENYLDKLRDSLQGVKVVEVGRSIPSVKLEPGQELFLCCPEHSHGGIDPHWWHSAGNMARAARIIAAELAEVDPANAPAYKAGGVSTARNMQALQAWAERELSRVPKADRKLVTAHAAFGYFCKEFGFKTLPVLGLGAEEDYSPKFVAEAIQTIRREGIPAVFPEDQANPKVLKEIVRATGVKVSPTALIADGTSPGAGSTFEGMLKHNVRAITATLAPPAKR